MKICIKCGSSLSHDEMAVYKRMINRNATEYMCKGCLAQYCGCSPEIIDVKIQQFKDNGCVLFEPDRVL